MRRLLQPRLDAVCVQFGYPPGFGRRLWSDAEATLAQMTGIRLRIEGDPRAAGARNVRCTLSLVPEPDTALSRWLQALAPGPKGALPLPEGAAAAKLQLSLQPDRAPAVTGPFTRFMVESGAGDAAERQARQDDLRRDLELWDGTLSLQVDQHVLAVFVGTKQPEASAKQLADPARLQREQEAYERRRIELSFKHAALRHRGVDALAIEATTDLPTGELPAAMSSYRAIAGACKVIVGAAKLPAEAMRAAIDRCLDGKQAPAPLPGNALLLVDLDMALIRAMLPGGMAAGGEAPDRRIRLALHVTDTTLELTLELR